MNFYKSNLSYSAHVDCLDDLKNKEHIGQLACLLLIILYADQLAPDVPDSSGKAAWQMTPAFEVDHPYSKKVASKVGES